MPESALAVLRKDKKLTQAELGKQVFLRLNKEPSGGYPQKKVSLWESGEGRPTPEECKALSEILEVPVKRIQAFFDPRAPHIASDVFEQLANSNSNAIIAACFSGPPVGPLYPDLLSTLEKGIDNKLCYAMVVPYPKLQVKKGSASTERLQWYYESVLRKVREYCEELQRRVAPEKRENIALFVPRAEHSSFPLPPFRSRYILSVQSVNDNKEDMGLYLWVKTAEIDQLQEVATTVALAEPSTPTETRSEIREQLKEWEMYFNDILSVWRENQSLNREAIMANSDSMWKLA